jgi:hypothetical protein
MYSHHRAWPRGCAWCTRVYPPQFTYTAKDNSVSMSIDGDLRGVVFTNLPAGAVLYPAVFLDNNGLVTEFVSYFSSVAGLVTVLGPTSPAAAGLLPPLFAAATDAALMLSVGVYTAVSQVGRRQRARLGSPLAVQHHGVGRAAARQCLQ